MSSTEHSLSSAERLALLRTARQVIEHGAGNEGNRPGTPALAQPELQREGASFVTLHRDGNLRGCIGTLEPCRALIADVAVNAHGAAFRDPRFRPVEAGELADLSVAISVLSPREPLPVKSEDELLALLRPGIDGLVLTMGGRRGTFLPSVWENLQTPHEFLRQLKLKAGLPPDFWSDRFIIERYTTEYFAE